MKKMFKIRKAELKDVDFLLELHTLSWEKAYYNLFSKDFIKNLRNENNLNRKKRNFQNDIQHNKFIEIYLLELKSRIVGFIILAYPENDTIKYGEIKALYTLPTLTNQGIGKTLLKYSIDIFREKKCENIILWVFKENVIARRFYEKNFFYETNEREFFFIEKIEALKYSFDLNKEFYESKI